MKMTESIKSQIKSFLEGFYEVIPKELISIFNEQELELLISGLPTIDIDDLKSNSEYRNYQENSLQVNFPINEVPLKLGVIMPSEYKLVASPWICSYVHFPCVGTVVLAGTSFI